MGLDITAYRKVRFVRTLKRGEDGDEGWPRITYLYPNPDFETRADGLREGLYEVSGDYERASAAEYRGGEPDPDQLKFRAGSYSGYSQWRAELARMAGSKADWRGEWSVPEAGPFVELIDFSDCEGIIGPKTSAKLAKDFAEWQERAEAHAKKLTGQEGEWFLGSYALWRQAFEMAAGEGAVCFH